jgi:uncharacterized membrane protein
MRECRYATTTRGDGSFRISGVAAGDRPYTVLAFIDTDGDNVYTVGTETGRVAETAAVIDTVGAAATGIRIELSGDLEAPAPAESGEEE